MNMDSRQRFQGKCFRSEEGYLYMNSYDALPRSVQLALQNSEFNICCACVHDISRSIVDIPREQRLLMAVRIIETELKNGQGQ